MESELCIVRRVEEEYRALNPPPRTMGGASSGRFSVGSSQKSSRSGGARSWRLRSSTPLYDTFMDCVDAFEREHPEAA